MNNFGSLVLLKVNNLRAIEIVEIPMGEDGKLIRLTGDNGTGKTTVIEAIETLFNGGKLPDGVIRRGQKEALIEGRFSTGYVAKRRVRKSKSGKQVAELVVTDPDGNKMMAAGAILKSLFSGFITPAKMAGSSGAALYNEIKAQIGIDLGDREQKVANLKERASEIRAELNVLGRVEEPEEARPMIPEIDEERLSVLDNKVYEAKTAKGLITVLEHQQQRTSREIEECKQRIEVLEEELEESRKQKEEHLSKIEAAQEIEEEWQIMKQAAKDRTEKAQLVKNWETYESWQKATDTAAEKLEEALREQSVAENEIRSKLAAAVGPGDVRVDENRQVFIGKTPWEIAAFSERILAATLMQIESLEESTLPIVFIEHGEGLNTEKQQEIAHAAITKGATVFIEVMDEDIKDLVITTETEPDPEWVKNAPEPMEPAALPEATEEASEPTPVQASPSTGELGLEEPTPIQPAPEQKQARKFTQEDNFDIF